MIVLRMTKDVIIERWRSITGKTQNDGSDDETGGYQLAEQAAHRTLLLRSHLRTKIVPDADLSVPVHDSTDGMVCRNIIHHIRV